MMRAARSGEHLEQLLVVRLGALPLLSVISVPDFSASVIAAVAMFVLMPPDHERDLHRVTAESISARRDSVNPRTANFVVQYALIDACAMIPFKLEMLTTCPFTETHQIGQELLGAVDDAHKFMAMIRSSCRSRSR